MSYSELFFPGYQACNHTINRNRGKFIFHFTILLFLLLFPINSNGQEHYPATKFWVFSDPHFYSPALGTEGAAFDTYLENDRKLLKEGPFILKEAFKLISQNEADFLLIPGDLTKDGTLESHQAFANFLLAIE